MAIALTLALAVGSYVRWSSGKKSSAAAASAANAPMLGYMPARWRLATFDEVNHVTMWVSHIVIQHDESLLDDPSFRPPGWAPDPPRPKRTKAEALERALMVADLARKNPDRFAELAKAYSDDIETKDLGGSLGGIRLGQLPAEYRDALAVLKPGETSRVMQTALGFEVIQRRPMPPAGTVSGRRIVIRYDGTVMGVPGATVHRKRDAALSLAKEVAAQARRNSKPFEELVERYSENADVAQLGDMGVWSVQDPGFMPREIEQLSALGIGEVSDPLDSVFGFEILLRVAPTERPRYAMTAIAIPFDPALEGDGERSFTRVWQVARDLAESLRKDPSQFEALQKKYCCSENQSWTLGRGPVGLVPVLDKLAFGAIAGEPLRGEGLVWIPKRLDPASVPEEPGPRYELPNPRAPDFDRMIRDAEGHGLVAMTHLFAAEVKRAVHFEGSAATEVPKRLDALAAIFDKNLTDPAARVRAFHQMLSDMKTLLGPQYGQFEAFMNEWGARLVIMGHA